MPTRILILGGGFAGAYTARHLQDIWGRDDSVEITLVSRNNYFEMTPLLFECASGVLDPRHAVVPVRRLFRSARFVEADVTGIDLDRRTVAANLVQRYPMMLRYDHLVLAMGGVTNTRILPGAAEHGMTFKTMADAIALRNHVIRLFERADVEADGATKRSLMSCCVIGGGFVGVELMGELTDFLPDVSRAYPNVDPKCFRYELVEAGPQVAPEFDPDLAEYAADVLRGRGVRIRTNTRVNRIEENCVYLSDEDCVEAHTVLVATGVIANPLVASLAGVQHGPRGRVIVEPSMRAVGREDVWATGDNAQIPDPEGKPYPPLAQQALREARCLAENITSAIKRRPLRPFVYRNKGSLASLGHYKGVGRVMGVRIRGFIAWWVRRTYYLFQVPGWDRRLRLVIDWTVELFFKTDVVQLNLEQSRPAVCDPPAPPPVPGDVAQSPDSSEKRSPDSTYPVGASAG